MNIRIILIRIIATHTWGRPCEVDLLIKIAKKNNLKLLFDAAHAFGCSYRGEMIGHFGDAEIFSFHATKFFNTFEGGAVVTNNDELAKKIRLMKNFGFSGMDNVVYIGTNGKMSEISAAMGLTSFESINDFISTNELNYRAYKRIFSDVNGMEIIEYDLKEKNNFHYIVFELNEEKFGINRDDLVKILHFENIRVRRYFFPGCHKMEPYKSINSNLKLPETEKILLKVLILPNGFSVNEKVIKEIHSLLLFIQKNSKEINKKLK